MRSSLVLLFTIFVSLQAEASRLCEHHLTATSGAKDLTTEEIQDRKLEKQWHATGLSLEGVLTKMDILSDEMCKGSVSGALDCIAMLNALARTGRPPFALIPQNSLKHFKEEVLSVERHFGPLALVRIKSAFKWNPRLGMKDLVDWINQRTLLVEAEIEKIYQNPKLDYYEIAFFLDSLVITPEREASQVAAAINAVLYRSDSHSRIQSEGALLDQDSDAGNQSWAGLGVGLRRVKKEYEITYVLPKSPAARAGVRAGDILLKISGKVGASIEWSELRRSIEGPVGSTVDLELRRGEELLKIRATRDKVHVENVEGNVVTSSDGQKIGHINIRTFLNEHTCSEVKQQMQRLESKGVSGFVLDVRQNAGGMMVEAQCIAGLFLGKILVARQRDLQSGKTTPIRATHRKITDLPVVVLIDALSASASELLAGAIRDHHRGWTMGERSMGKGSVQEGSLFDISPPEKEKVVIYRTTARFEQPSGSSNQLYGIVPQFPVVAVPNEPDQEVPREAEMSPNSPSRSRKMWHEARPNEVHRLKLCLERSGRADKEYVLLRSLGKAADYRVLKAMDLLHCQNDQLSAEP